MDLNAQNLERQKQLLLFCTTQYVKTSVDLVSYKQKANFWQTQFTKSKQRELDKDHQIEELKALLKKREHQLFGKKSEKKSTKPDDSLSSAHLTEEKKRPRGQQHTNKGPQRRNYAHLPETKEISDLPENHKICPCCNKPYEAISSTENTTVVEIINVKAYQRKIIRKKYQRCCECKENNLPKIITSPAPNRLIPRCILGISIWSYLLMQKYNYQRPQHNTLQEMRLNGLDLAKGTITEGFKFIKTHYLLPIYNLIQERSLSSNHWHADETGWKVFEEIEGKVGNKWYLWIFKNDETTLFKMEPTRSTEALNKHFAKSQQGVLNVDRYCAYKAIAKSGLLVLAFCWAHVRRDFLDHARSYPQQQEWAFAWVNRIGSLYKINNERIKHAKCSHEFKQLDKILHEELNQFKNEIDKQLVDKNLLPSAVSRVKSLNRHWNGLTIFADQPEIPMDNNIAENGLRKPVVGRKGYYGSGSVWSAELSAICHSIFATLQQWGINPHSWLLWYLNDCAICRQSPANIESYLPWNMAKEHLQSLSTPPALEDSS